MKKPTKPDGMNGHDSFLWDAIDSLRGRVDGLYSLVLGGVAVMVAAIGVVGGLVIALD